MSRWLTVRVALCFLLLAGQFVCAEELKGYLVAIENDQLIVRAVGVDQLPETAVGFYLFSEEGRDRWVFLAKGWQSRLSPETVSPPTANDPNWVRGSRGPSGTSESALSLARGVQLPPANPTASLRAVPFYTPIQESQILSHSPIVRRVPKSKTAPYPAEKATLTNTVSQEKLELLFPEGEASTALKNLKPGTYRLNAEAGDAVTFTIVDPAKVGSDLAAIREFEAAVGADSPAAIAFQIERMISDKNPNEHTKDQANARDKDGYPRYLGDVLDLTDRALAAQSTPYLLRVRGQLFEMAQRKANVKPEAKAASASGLIGIPQLDAARDAILAGRWQEADKFLAEAEKLQTPKDRAKGLALHYRAVLMAEGGPKRAVEAEGLYKQSLEILQSAAAMDRVRAHANYAAFLQQQAQDSLNQFAFQTASGVQAPLFHALQLSVDAGREYETAAKLATAAARPSIHYNQARLLSLQSDLARTLDEDGKSSEVAAIVQNLSRQESALLEQALADKGDDPLVRGNIFELKAQIAFRNRNPQGCESAAKAAIAIYAAEGSFLGLEQVYRLLGQNALAAGNRESALRAFIASQQISELLRDRLVGDRAGQTQAGFFSRRAFVLDSIVELLLLAGGRDAEAVRYLEMAKARSLQDTLAKRLVGPDVGRSVPAILSAFPEKTVVLEYFLGREKAWVFTIARSQGVTEVKAHELTVAPRELLTRVQAFLREIEGYAPKMLNKFLSTKAFDNNWQFQLHQFRKDLIPDSAFQIVKQADSVVIVPQHLLHYFPFAALVTEPEPQAKNPDNKKVAKPKFLVDERFVLSSAPSLTTWDMLHRRPAVGIKEVNAVGLVQAPGENPLPGVETDLNNLQAAFGKVKILQDQQATVSGARSLLQRPGLLLLATHGFNEADQPLESFLILLPDAEKSRSTDDANDGKLRAKDIFDKPVGPDLVVMSACYTGLADRSPLPGDDLFGLQRAFLFGGARTVIGGYWDVYDGTAPELLGTTMKLLAQKRGIGAALKQSQIQFLAKCRESDKAEPYLHPYFWAMYSLLGDERTGAGK